VSGRPAGPMHGFWTSRSAMHLPAHLAPIGSRRGTAELSEMACQVFLVREAAIERELGNWCRRCRQCSARTLHTKLKEIPIGRTSQLRLEHPPQLPRAASDGTADMFERDGLVDMADHVFDRARHIRIGRAFAVVSINPLRAGHEKTVG